MNRGEAWREILNGTHDYMAPYYNLREFFLGVMLASLAGATGAAAWIYSAGWYVTFMTGNTERMVLEPIRGSTEAGLAALSAVVVFVIGALTATLARIYLWSHARHGAMVVTTIAIILAFLSDLWLGTQEDGLTFIPILFLAFGLGALNTSISRRGQVVMPLSYVTGTLVKIGQGIALHLAGKQRWMWFPQLATYLGFVCGAAVGGTAFYHQGVENALFLLSLGAMGMTAVTWRVDHHSFLRKDEH
ncbi:YoaK family protein [Corynebacterium sp. 22KM0430]|uniref:YoaK family protein n=1 Tax=Corynebacterium sp. 22KM0430 TaxID=2989735 RepID=UPI0029CA2AE2|nr:YoaK family protein [Corynebacterium sp. 22KM0430]WPF65846.1 YoaK family protein [Corynebacterium sp. 22KM0430]